MAASHFDEQLFKEQVDRALTVVKRNLHLTRNPQLPSEVAHTYNDKYLLSEQITNCVLVAVTDSLTAMGITPDNLKTMRTWVQQGHEVTLRFSTKDRVIFEREEKRIEGSPTLMTKITKDRHGVTDEKMTSTSVEMEVTDYVWKYEVCYSMLAFKSASPDEGAIVAQNGAESCEIITKVKQSPGTMTDSGGHDAGNVKYKSGEDSSISVTWLLEQLSENLQFSFRIDRTKDSCKTPRRNEDIEGSCRAIAKLAFWCSEVRNRVRSWQTCGGTRTPKSKRRDAGQVRIDDIFVPVLPFFDHMLDVGGITDDDRPEITISSNDTGSQVALTASDITLFLNEHSRAIQQKNVTLQEEHPEHGLASAMIVILSGMAEHLMAISHQYHQSIFYIEHLLEQQLCAAIGREVNAQSFHQFMKHHCMKLYKPAYKPKQFCYAVRRSECSPEGIVSIECSKSENDPTEPISTIVRQVEPGVMNITLNPQCTVELSGSRYLHAYLAQNFRENDINRLSLVARARQFSSFILMIGKIGSDSTFQPKHAIIIKDKDQVTIPLLLETLPSAKDFNDAIESISPEQQRFAKAYRELQLEGTVFAVAMIQLKPQLERLLNLLNGSLVKEIKLSQQLEELFIEHQIPSDLLSFDGDGNASKSERITAVKEHVKSIMEMIEEEKQSELNEATMQFGYTAFGGSAAFGGSGSPAYSPTSPSYSMGPFGAANTRGDSDRGVPQGFGGNSGGIFGGRGGQGGNSGGIFGGRCGPFGGGGGRDGHDKMMSQGVQHSQISSMRQGSSMMTSGKIKQPQIQQMQQSKQVAPQSGLKLVSDTAQKSFMEIDSNVDDIGAVDSGRSIVDGAFDFTNFPATLDKRFLELDSDNALRPTKIKVLEGWVKESRAGLLAQPSSAIMWEDHKRSAKNKAYDLLDAISRSGTLPIKDCASLHVMVAVTHVFERSVMDTVIKDNVNPIEKVERSSLIIAEAVHNERCDSMIEIKQLDRVLTHSYPLTDN